MTTSKEYPVSPKASETQQTAKRRSGRLYFVDHLRVLLTILVVVHHIAVTYSGIPIWYYTEPTQGQSAGLLLVLIFVNQGFFMGLFFMISAYFTPGSYNRKGAGSFLRERLLRLGVPLAVFYFVIGPATALSVSIYQGDTPLSLQAYLERLGFGPTWFLEALLIFTLVYASVRYLTRSRAVRDEREFAPLTYRMLTGFTATLVVVTFLWRMAIPVGFWTPIIDFPTLAYLPQYAGLFVLGVVAYRRDWFTTIPDSMGRIGWTMALASTLIFLPLTFITMPDSMGGGSWQGIFYATWDSIFCVGISLGLLTFFRKRLGGESRLGDFLAGNSYAVFVVHAPVIVAISLALASLNMASLLKFAVVAVIGVPICFAVAALVRKLPLVSKVL